MDILPTNVLYYGREDPLPERVLLRAGPLSLVYEAGDLRYVKLGEREILRRVYVALRDRNWGTVPARLSNVQMDVGDDAFRITYDAEHEQGDIDFCWKGTIAGDAQGTITFAMDGLARSTFLRNRIGFCVLHPMCECAGQPCIVEKVDGTVEQGTFPERISPHQPFVEMRAISHPVLPGVWAHVRLGGEVFEMEDQRNWSDASFKTYSTPLAFPFPVEVQEGTRIAQSVTLTLKGEIPALPVEPASAELTFAVGASPGGPLPRIGLGMASHGQPLSENALAHLRKLNLSHLRVDLRLSRPQHLDVLRRATAEAKALNLFLEIALHLSGDAADELAALRAELEQIRPPVCTWLVFDAATGSRPARLAELARSFLADYHPAAMLGGGTNVYFAQLNRERPPIHVLDLVCHSINPQVHAFDNASLVEALQTQAAIVSSARQFIGDCPLAVTPVTLKPRFNPSATGPEPAPTPTELPPQVDVRQMSLLGAGWTAASLKYLTENGVYSATYYETSGWRGVMETEVGSPLPALFRSLPGTVYPLYHVLADVGEFAGGQVVPTTASDPLRVDGLAVYKGGRMGVILANLTAEPQQVTVRNLTERVRVQRLDERTVEGAMRTPDRFRAQEGERVRTAGRTLKCHLLPYAVWTLFL